MGRHRQGRIGVPLWRAPWLGACLTAVVLTTGASYMAGTIVPSAHMPPLPESEVAAPSASVDDCAPDCAADEDTRGDPRFMPALGPATAASGPASASASVSPSGDSAGSTPADENSTAGDDEGASDRSGRADGPGAPGDAPPTGGPSAPQGSERQVTIAYRTVDRNEERFTTAVTIANDGSRAISDWTLRLHFREIRMHDASGAAVSQSGDTVTASGAGGSAAIAPGQAVSFEIEASGPDPMPSGCSFNGRRCQD